MINIPAEAQAWAWSRALSAGFATGGGFHHPEEVGLGSGTLDHAPKVGFTPQNLGFYAPKTWDFTHRNLGFHPPKFGILRTKLGILRSSLIWPAGYAPAALASLLFDPPEPQIIGETQRFATFLPFRAPGSSFS